MKRREGVCERKREIWRLLLAIQIFMHCSVTACV